MRVAVMGVDDESFLSQLADRTVEIARKTPRKGHGDHLLRRPQA
jgi:hypothetical protein